MYRNKYMNIRLKVKLYHVLSLSIFYIYLSIIRKDVPASRLHGFLVYILSKPTVAAPKSSTPFLSLVIRHLELQENPGMLVRDLVTTNYMYIMYTPTNITNIQNCKLNEM